MTTPSQSDLLTPAQVSEQFPLRENRLAKLRCAGGGPRFLKIGRSVYYRRADIEAWLDAHARVSTSDPGQGGGAK